MSSFPLFKDVGKSANDLLKKGYPLSEKYTFRIEYETVSSSGIQINPFVQETVDKNVEGELKTKFTYKDIQITTTGNMKEDVSFEIAPPAFAKGAKGTFNVSGNINDFLDRIKTKGTVEFRNDFSTTAIALENVFSRKGGKSEDVPKVNFSTVFGSKEKGVSFGIDTEVSVMSQQLKTWNSAIAINKPDLDLTIFSKTKVGGSTNVGVSYFQKYPGANPSDVSLGGEISYDLSNKSASFLLGGQCKPNEFTTTKARFDSQGFLGFSYTEKWRGPLSVTFMSDWNVLGAPIASPFQYGIKLSFK